MAIYLPRGGDYERALRFIGAARGIDGVIKGAESGLRMVSNVQKIVDDSLDYEIKEENFRATEAARLAKAVGGLDALSGGGVGGEGGGGGGGGGRSKGARGGGGGRDEGMTAEDKAQLAELFHTLGKLEEYKAKAGPQGVRKGRAGAGILETQELGQEPQEAVIESAVDPLAGVEGDEWEPTWRYKGGEAELRAAQKKAAQREKLPSLPMDEERTPTDLDRSLAAVGLGEDKYGKRRRAQLSPMLAADEIDPNQLEAALEKMGAADPGITVRPGDIPVPMTAGPPVSEGVLGEGLVNPAVAMGFTGRTVIDPVTQAYLFDLHRRGSAVPTSVANMLGIDRDQMFKPGAVRRSAEYKSKLTQALKRFEANDYAALERVTLERLKAAKLVDKDGNPALTEDELIALSKDMSHLSESERKDAIKDLRYNMEYDKAFALAELKQHTYRHTRSGRGKSEKLELYKSISGDIRGMEKNLVRLNAQEQKARSSMELSGAEKPAAIRLAQDNVKRQKDQIARAHEQRNIYYRQIHNIKDPAHEAPDLGGGEDVVKIDVDDNMSQNLIGDWKNRGYTRAQVVDAIKDNKDNGWVYAPAIEGKILAEFPEALPSEDRTEKEARAKKSLEKNPMISDADLARARKDKKTLESVKVDRDISDTADMIFEAEKAGEEVIERARGGQQLTEKEVSEAMEQINRALAHTGHGEWYSRQRGAKTTRRRKIERRYAEQIGRELDEDEKILLSMKRGLDRIETVE